MHSQEYVHMEVEDPLPRRKSVLCIFRLRYTLDTIVMLTVSSSTCTTRENRPVRSTCVQFGKIGSTSGSSQSATVKFCHIPPWAASWPLWTEVQSVVDGTVYFCTATLKITFEFRSFLNVARLRNIIFRCLCRAIGSASTQAEIVSAQRRQNHGAAVSQTLPCWAWFWFCTPESWRTPSQCALNVGQRRSFQSFEFMRIGSVQRCMARSEKHQTDEVLVNNPQQGGAGIPAWVCVCTAYV